METILVSLDMGNVCRCAPVFNFVSTVLGGAMAKRYDLKLRLWRYTNVYFSHLKGDTMYR